MSIEELVEKYIMLRDKKAAIMNAAKEKCAAIEAALTVAENTIMALLNEHGLDSLGCASGTAYRTTRTSATVADWDATLQWIKDNDAFHMLERRVAKTAVEEYVKAEGDLPPGVNWKQDVTINVRRS